MTPPTHCHLLVRCEPGYDRHPSQVRPHVLKGDIFKAEMDTIIMYVKAELRVELKKVGVMGWFILV